MLLKFRRTASRKSSKRYKFFRETFKFFRQRYKFHREKPNKKGIPHGYPYIQYKVNTFRSEMQIALTLV